MYRMWLLRSKIFVDDLEIVDVVQYEMVKVELIEYDACEV